MGIFYVKKSKRALSKEHEQKQLKNDDANVHIDYDQLDCIQINDNLILAHFAVSNYFYKSHDTFYFEKSGDGIVSATIIQGYCYRRVCDRSTTTFLNAQQINRILSEVGYNIEKFRHECGGEYSIVHVSIDSSVYVFNDCVGLEHVYYYRDEDECLISNRIALIQANKNKREDFDYTSMLSMPATTFLTPDCTYLKNVNRLKLDYYLAIEPNAFSLENRRMPPSFFTFGRMQDGFDAEIFKDLMNKGINECISWLKLATQNVDKIPLALTGGKDSRAVLAVCLLAGLKDKLELFTIGHPDHPEVQVARIIAEQFGLKHEIRQRTVPKDISAEEFLKNIATHVFQTEGLMNAWDIQNRGGANLGFSLTGFCGEYFRPYKTSAKLSGQPHPADYLFRYNDPLGVIKNATKSEIKDRILNFLAEYEQDGFTPEDLSNIYYIACANCGWLGASTRLSSYLQIALKPLNSFYLTNLAFALPPEVRATEIIHYSIIETYSKELADIPFYVQSWSPQLERYGKKLSTKSAPIPATNEFKQFGSWQYKLNDEGDLVMALKLILTQHKKSIVWQHIDQNKLISHLTNGNMSFSQLHSLMGILTVFFKGEKIELPRKLYNRSKILDKSSVISLESEHHARVAYQPFQHTAKTQSEDKSDYGVNRIEKIFSVNSHSIDFLNPDSQFENLLNLAQKIPVKYNFQYLIKKLIKLKAKLKS